MKVLLDCSHLQTGGALQVGLATLDNAARTPEHEWHVVLSGRLAAQFPPAREKDFASLVRLPIRNHPLAKYWQIVRTLPEVEKRVRPDIVYVVLGPPKWRSRAPQLAGYAVPHLLYPETDAFAGRAGLTRERIYLALFLMGVRHDLHQAQNLVVETETVRKRLEAVEGFPRSRVFVVRNSYSPQFEKALGRDGSSAPRDRFSVFVPSAYYHHKNLEIVPKVAAELRTLTDRPFEFVMTLPESERGWHRIRDLARTLGVEASIRNVGPVP